APGGLQGGAARRGAPPPRRCPPAAAERLARRRPAGAGRDRRRLVTRRVSILLLAAGGWTLFVWITRLVNMAGEDRSAGFYVVHRGLAFVSIALGLAAGGGGWEAVRAGAGGFTGTVGTFRYGTDAVCIRCC